MLLPKLQEFFRLASTICNIHIYIVNVKYHIFISHFIVILTTHLYISGSDYFTGCNFLIRIFNHCTASDLMDLRWTIWSEKNRGNLGNHEKWLLLSWRISLKQHLLFGISYIISPLVSSPWCACIRIFLLNSSLSMHFSLVQPHIWVKMLCGPIGSLFYSLYIVPVNNTGHLTTRSVLDHQSL